jgi:tellurite resistance-related uncharacterized protein
MDEGGDAACWADRVCDRCGRISDGPHSCQPEVGPVTRVIDGFHQDEEGDWVAELSCLHNQHVRHRPPFVLRPWVQTAEGRSGRVGTPIECPLCARAELPEGLVAVRRAGPFDERTTPSALRHDHVIAERTWGLLQVLDGQLGFQMESFHATLRAGDQQPIPPGVRHLVELDHPARFRVDFLRAPGRS